MNKFSTCQKALLYILERHSSCPTVAGNALNTMKNDRQGEVFRQRAFCHKSLQATSLA